MHPKIVLSEAGVKEEANIRYILEHSAQATIFHTPEWSKLVAAEFGVSYHTLIASIGHKSVGMYTFFIEGGHAKSSPYKHIISPLRDVDSIYGGPIGVKSEIANEEVVRELLRGVRKFVPHWVEYYKILTPPGYPVELLQKLSYKCKKMLTSIIELNYKEEDLWRRVDGKRRSLIRKAISKGLQITDCRLQITDFIEAYYPMLLEVFGKSGKKPFPKSYYQRVIQTLTPNEWVKPVLVLYQGKPIAGAIFLCFKETVYYWSGASFREYGHLSANDFIQWELIKWARTNNYKYYDLLVVEPERLPRIAHFKLGFGGELVPIYEAIHRTPLGQLTRVVNFVKSKIKLQKSKL